MDTKINFKTEIPKRILKFKAPRYGGGRSPFSLLQRRRLLTPTLTPIPTPSPSTIPSPPSSTNEQVKHHPTVKAEPEPWDIHDYPPHPTCVYERLVDIWKRQDIEAVKKSDVGSAGVLFVRHKDGIIVLKACATLGQELFGAGLADQLGVRVPAMRVVDDEEFKAIADAILPKDKPTANDFGIMPSFDNLFMVVMEFAPGHSLEQLAPEEAECVTSDLLLQQIGALMILDVIINNSDRLPFGTLWSNPGNLGNVLIQATDDSGKEVMCLFGVDNRAMTITDENLLEKNNIKLKENLEDLFTNKIKSRVIEKVTSLINKEFGIMKIETRLTEKHQEQIYNGMLSAVRECSKITSKTLEDLYKEICSYVNEDDKEDEWKNMCKDIDHAYHSKIVSLIQSEWKIFSDQNENREFPVDHRNGSSSETTKNSSTLINSSIPRNNTSSCNEGNKVQVS